MLGKGAGPFRPQQFLNLKPLPHGHWAFPPIRLAILFTLQESEGRREPPGAGAKRRHARRTSNHGCTSEQVVLKLEVPFQYNGDNTLGVILDIDV